MKPSLLSKREVKFRNRFIAEHHYNKTEQRLFDESVIKLGLSYLFIYKSVKKGANYPFMIDIAINRVSEAMFKLANVFRVIAITACQYSKEISRLSEQ